MHRTRRAGLTNQSDFFTSPVTQGMYKDFVAAILNRRNTINGRLYRDDPTVMSWDLLNEVGDIFFFALRHCPPRAPRAPLPC